MQNVCQYLGKGELSLSEGSNYVVDHSLGSRYHSMYARGERDPFTFGPNLLSFEGRYLKKVGISDQDHRTWCQVSKV